MADKYRVIKGIFEGHVFFGEPRTINEEQRIWDLGTVGRAYYAEYCELITEEYHSIGTCNNTNCPKCGPEINSNNQS